MNRAARISPTLLGATALLIAGCSGTSGSAPGPATSTGLSPAVTKISGTAASTAGGAEVRRTESAAPEHTTSTPTQRGTSAQVTVTVIQESTGASGSPEVTVRSPTGSGHGTGASGGPERTSPVAESRTMAVMSTGRRAVAPSTTRPKLASVDGHPLPQLTPSAADFRDPETVAARYLSAWCYMPVDGPANLNIAHAADWMTAAGYDDDKSRAIGDATWRQIQDQHITTACGPVHTTINENGPATGRRKFVMLQTTRYRVADGQVIDSDTIDTQRRVLRTDNGQWLVDIQVLAG